MRIIPIYTVLATIVFISPVQGNELDDLESEVEYLLNSTDLAVDIQNGGKIDVDTNQCKIIRSGPPRYSGSPGYIATIFLDKVYDIEAEVFSDSNGSRKSFLSMYCIENCYAYCYPEDEKCNRSSDKPTAKATGEGLNNNALSNRKLVFDVAQKLNKIKNLCKSR